MAACENMDETVPHSLCQFLLSQPEFFWCILAIWFGYAFIDIKQTVNFMGCWNSLPCRSQGGSFYEPVGPNAQQAGNVSDEEEHAALIVTAAPFKVKCVVFSLA